MARQPPRPACTFTVWAEALGPNDGRVLQAGGVEHAAELRAGIDYDAAPRAHTWPRGYVVRDDESGHLWTVVIVVVARPAFSAVACDEIPMPPATHVLWGGEVQCADLRLRGVPATWPDQQRWISLKDAADEATEVPADACAACWTKAKERIAMLHAWAKEPVSS